MDPHLINGVILTFVPILLSLSVHEFAHARTALAFGDPTAKLLGRCTLNPLKHLDPLGTLAMFFIGFGWAKPVPVNFANLHPQRLGNVSVSLAGPASNFGIALLCVVALRVMAHFGVVVNSDADFRPTDLAAFLLMFTALINILLCVFNLIPLFPLDGHHIGREALPGYLRQAYMRWQIHYGRWILLALLLVPNVLGRAGLDVPNPLGWYFSHALFPSLEAMLGTEGGSLGYSALVKFRSYLLWFN